jgi:hypothetical protein
MNAWCGGAADDPGDVQHADCLGGALARLHGGA